MSFAEAACHVRRCRCSRGARRPRGIRGRASSPKVDVRSTAMREAYAQCVAVCGGPARPPGSVSLAGGAKCAHAAHAPCSAAAQGQAGARPGENARMGGGAVLCCRAAMPAVVCAVAGGVGVRVVRGLPHIELCIHKHQTR